MNREEYIQRMSDLGYSQRVAESLIRLSKDSADLALRVSNFVPAKDGLYEIWVSGDRDDFYRASGDDGQQFVGTLGEAYEYVFEQTRRWRDTQTDT